MAKQIRPDIITGEKEYFFRRDLELIQEIRAKEKAKADAKERSAHKGHCSRCGGGMHEWTVNGLLGLACGSCNEVAIDLEVMRSMVQGRHGAEVLEEIDKTLQSLRSKSA